MLFESNLDDVHAEGLAYSRYMNAVGRASKLQAQAECGELSDEDVESVYHSNELMTLWENGAAVEEVRAEIQKVRGRAFL